MAILFEYLLNEASSGNTPANALDSGPHSANLPINYNSGDIEYGSNAEGNGLNFLATASSSPASAQGLITAALAAALNGKTTITLYIKHNTANQDAFLLDLFNGSNRFISYVLAVTGLHSFDFGGFWGFAYYNAQPMTCLRFDTSAANIADRFKIYTLDGSNNLSQITPDGGYPADSALPQNTPINGSDTISEANTNLVLGNRFDQDANANGLFKYVGMVDEAQSEAQITAALQALAADDDTSPLAEPTLAFVSAPSLSAVTSSGFDLSLTTNLAATIDVLITLTADQPSDAAFDAATFGGNSGAYSVYSESLTGLNSETTYYVHVRATDGTTTLYAYDSATTMAVQNAILSINGGNPIRLNQTGIVVIWDGGATGTTTTTINGVAQANHTVISDTETRFDFVWPATRYGQTETLDIDGTQFVTPQILPQVGYDYVTASGYNEAEPGTIPTNPDVVDSDQAVWDTEGGTVSLSAQLIPSFTGAFDGDITIAIVDAADGAHSSFDTYYYQAPADAVPDQFDVGLDVVDAEPGAEITGSFVVAGIDAGVSVTFAATASMLVSTDGATWVTSITRQLGETVFHRIVAGPVDTTRTGGISAGGVVDSKTVTTRAATVPVITTQPGNQSVTAGVNASFTAAATNVANWQWQKDTQGNGTFADIAGATSATLSYPTTLANNGDQFRAVATSSEGGTTTTSAAMLTVIAQAATLTTDVLRDASGALLASQSIDVEVWTPGAGATQLWSGQLTTDAAGVATVTNNQMGDAGDSVDVRFPGLQNSFNSVRYILQ